MTKKQRKQGKCTDQFIIFNKIELNLIVILKNNIVEN